MFRPTLARGPRTGGDTLFASVYAADDAPSNSFKQALEALRACHSNRHVFGREPMARHGDLNGGIGNPELATQDTVHPVVIQHPKISREALYVIPASRRVSTARATTSPRQTRSPGRCRNIFTGTRSGPHSPAAFIAV